MPRPSIPVERPDNFDALCVTCGVRFGDHYGYNDFECPERWADTWVRRPEGRRVYSRGFQHADLVNATMVCYMCDNMPSMHRQRDAACPTRPRFGHGPTGRYSRTRHYVPRNFWALNGGGRVMGQLAERWADSLRQRPQATFVTYDPPTFERVALPMTPTSPRRVRWPGEPGVYGYEHDGQTLCIMCTRDSHNVGAYTDSVPADEPADVVRDGNGIVLSPTTGQLRHRIGRTPEWCTPDRPNGCEVNCDRCFTALAEHSPSYHGWCDCGDGCESGSCDACSTPDVDEDERSTGCRCAHCTAPELPVMRSSDITLRAAPDVTDEQVAAYLATLGTPAELAEA